MCMYKDIEVSMVHNHLCRAFSSNSGHSNQDNNTGTKENLLTSPKRTLSH